MLFSGLDKVSKKNELLENLGRIGLVTNQTATTHDFESATSVLFRACKNLKKSSLTAIFGAQHGYFQTEQDNMIETPDMQFRFDDESKVPLFSLYSKTRIPTDEQMSLVDTLVVDLCDVGCRVYTYMLTLAGCLKAAAKHNKRVVVLDRPNPLGLSFKTNTQWERVGGDILDTKWHSFVGWYSIPMQHGLSMGELGKFFIAVDNLEVSYSVIEVTGLTRETSTQELRREHYILPSPNLPTWESAFLFPAFVMLEGANVSEGRGTTMPFQIVGAPFLEPEKAISFLKSLQKTSAAGYRTDGFVFRRHDFRPTFNKHHKEVCKGMQTHIQNSESVDLFSLGIEFIAHCCSQYPEDFRWKSPGYEYNETDLPILLILGQEKWLHYFESLKTSGWNKLKEEECKAFLKTAFEDAQNFAEETKYTHIYH